MKTNGLVLWKIFIFIVDFTWSDISSVHSSSTDSLIEFVKLLSLFEEPEERSHGAEIESTTADENGVVQDSSDFGEHRSDVFCSEGNLKIDEGSSEYQFEILSTKVDKPMETYRAPSASIVGN